MKTIELFGNVDECHRLSVDVPPEIPPGPIRIAIVVPSELIASNEEDDAGRDWMNGVAREWADELSDVRQDIYSLADGEPVDEAR